MGWIAFVALILATVASLPLVARLARRAGSKASIAGLALTIGMAFSVLFDPSTKAPTEEMQNRKTAGRLDEDAGGETIP